MYISGDPFLRVNDPFLRVNDPFLRKMTPPPLLQYLGVLTYYPLIFFLIQKKI